MNQHARLSDRFVADGTGRLVMQFRADGLFERGGALPQIMDTGGRVSIAAVLLDAGLFTSATGWNPCDTMPRDGQGANVAGFDPNACGAPRAGRACAAGAGHSARVRVASRPLVGTGASAVAQVRRLAGGRSCAHVPVHCPVLFPTGCAARARELNIEEAS
jgi:hypothetical protein